MNCVVDAMIVGVEKAGTTSLLRYLSEHPGIASHEAMEMPFFVHDETYQKGWDWAYKRYFVPKAQATVLLAKSVGCMYWERAPERLYAHNPSMRLIAVLRNPIERAYSAYWYAIQMGRESKKTFEEAIEVEAERLETGKAFHLRYHAYLRRGLYGEQLQRLFKMFCPYQVKVVIFEEFRADPQSTVSELFEFLSLKPAKVDTEYRHNQTLGRANTFFSWRGSQSTRFRRWSDYFLPGSLRNRAKTFHEDTGRTRREIPAINEKTRVRLMQFYDADIDIVEATIGRRISEWDR
jgi:hypothetical protein